MWPQLRHGIQRRQPLLELAPRICGEERCKRMQPEPMLALCGMGFRRSGALSMRASSRSCASPSAVRSMAFAMAVHGFDSRGHFLRSMSTNGPHRWCLRNVPRYRPASSRWRLCGAVALQHRPQPRQSAAQRRETSGLLLRRRLLSARRQQASRGCSRKVSGHVDNIKNIFGKNSFIAS